MQLVGLVVPVSVQVFEAKLFGGELAEEVVNVTVPAGPPLAPPEVSVTVAVQVVLDPAATGSHATAVEVFRLLTVRAKGEAVLAACVELPPYEAPMLCVPAVPGPGV